MHSSNTYIVTNVPFLMCMFILYEDNDLENLLNPKNILFDNKLKSF